MRGKFNRTTEDTEDTEEVQGRYNHQVFMDADKIKAMVYLDFLCVLCASLRPLR
jgi:hypothetical protein